MKFLALFISDLFHPVIFFLIMPYLVVYRQTTDSAYALKWMLFSSVFIVLGILLLIVGRLRGTFSDGDITKREERFRFYFFMAILAFLYLFVTIYFKGFFFSVSVIAIGVLLAIVTFWIVNYYIKSSIHIGVATAFVSTVAIMYGSIGFYMAAIVLPLLIWSRLSLKKHTPYEIIAGAGLGFVITSITFYLGLLLYQ